MGRGQSYGQLAKDRAYVLVEDSTLACGDQVALQGPATVRCSLTKVTNIFGRYMVNSCDMELYGQLKVMNKECDQSLDENCKFVSFENGLANFGWSDKADAENKQVLWAKKNHKNTSVTFEALAINEAFLRVVIRDRFCGEPKKQRCRFNKEMVGVTELLSMGVNPEDDSILSNSRDYSREQVGGKLQVTISNAKLAPYFAFNEEDAVDDEFEKITMGLTMQLEISQQGWKLRQKLSNNHRFARPTTSAFRKASWQAPSSDDKAPDGEQLGMLKPLCTVLFVPDNVRLVLAVCVTRSGTPGKYRWKLTESEEAQNEAKSGKKKRKKKRKIMNRCCALFKDYISSNKGRAQDRQAINKQGHNEQAHNEQKCSIFGSELKQGSSTGTVTLKWGPVNATEQYGHTFFVKMENEILGLYENDKSSQPIEMLKLTFGHNNQYEVVDIVESEGNKVGKAGKKATQEMKGSPPVDSIAL